MYHSWTLLFLPSLAQIWTCSVTRAFGRPPNGAVFPLPENTGACQPVNFVLSPRRVSFDLTAGNFSVKCSVTPSSSGIPCWEFPEEDKLPSPGNVSLDIAAFFHCFLPQPGINVVVQSLSRVWLCDPWTIAHQASLSITSSQSLLTLMFTESVMPSSHLILFRPLLLPPSIFPSIRLFSNESVLPIRWPKYWRFRFSISPSSEYSGLIFFRMDWLDLLAVQGTLKSLLQHHGLKALVLGHTRFLCAWNCPDKNTWVGC